MKGPSTSTEVDASGIARLGPRLRTKEEEDWGIDEDWEEEEWDDEDEEAWEGEDDDGWDDDDDEDDSWAGWDDTLSG